MKTPIVISIGGSLVAPPSGIDVAYLKKFRTLIYKHVREGRRFVIVVGGGAVTRMYQKASRAIVPLADEDLDWLGIHVTRLNGHLLRTIFRDIALHRVVKDPTRPLVWNKSVLIAAGWKPGWSTDYVAVRLARKFKAATVVNLTNIDGVYDADPVKVKTAKRIPRIDWKSFRKIVGSKWIPGANAPFDPIASRLAAQSRMTVAVMNGHDLKSLDQFLSGHSCRGTLIED